MILIALRTLEHAKAEAEEFVGLCQSAEVLMDITNPCVNVQEAGELLDDIHRLRAEIWRATLEQRLRGEVSGNKIDIHVLNPMQKAYVQAVEAYKALAAK